MQDKSYRQNAGTWKQAKKNTRTVASYNDITNNFFEAERLTFPEPHKPVTAMKISVW